MAIVFTQRVKHGTLDLIPGPVLAFEDLHAEDYFVAAGWAVTSASDPVVIYEAGSIVIDLETTVAGTTNRVLEA